MTYKESKDQYGGKPHDRGEKKTRKNTNSGGMIEFIINPSRSTRPSNEKRNKVVATTTGGTRQRRKCSDGMKYRLEQKQTNKLDQCCDFEVGSKNDVFYSSHYHPQHRRIRCCCYMHIYFPLLRATCLLC